MTRDVFEMSIAPAPVRQVTMERWGQRLGALSVYEIGDVEMYCAFWNCLTNERAAPARYCGATP